MATRRRRREQTSGSEGSASPTVVGSIEGLQAEIKHLRNRVATLEGKVETLKELFPEGEVIVLRTITREQAKQEIQSLFQAGETLFYSDIAQRLGVDLPLVVEICQELEEEGEIELDANAI